MAFDGRESVQLLGVSSSALLRSGSVPNISKLPREGLERKGLEIEIGEGDIRKGECEGIVELRVAAKFLRIFCPNFRIFSLS